MSTSQRTFDARIGRFKEGNNIIQPLAGYNPSNNLLKKLTINTYVTDVEAANTTVTLAEQLLINKQTARHLLVFTIGVTNPTCLEERINQIYTYLKGELGKTDASTRKVYSIVQKIKPRYKKKAPGTPRGAGASPSEKSFAAAPGFAKEVIDLITALGAAYAPTDPSLKAPALTILRQEIIDANKAVTDAEKAYGDANRARKKLYDGTTGMDKQISGIKGVLASFPGGKKSNEYIEFSDAIKGV
jgi:hypothetical protein